MTLSPSVDASRRSLVTRLLVPLLAALSLVLGPLAFAPAQAATSFTISGTVTGEGLPIAASIVLQEWDADDEEYYDQQWADSDEEDGTYRFEDTVGTGTYRVHVEANGFAPRNSAQFVLKSTSGAAKTVPVVNLETGGSITGTVTDDLTDAPIPFASVVAYPLTTKGALDWDGRRFGGVDEDGGFTLSDLTPGAYKIEISNEEGGHITEFYDDAADATSARTVTVVKDQSTSLDPIGLATGAKLRGVLQDDAGTAIPEWSVYALRILPDGEADYENAYGVVTDESGAYSVQGLPTGSYKLSLSENGDEYFDEFYNDQPDLDSADEIDVVVGDDIDLETSTLERKSRATGTVVDAAGEPLDDILVSAYRVRDGVVDEESTDYAYTGSFDGPGEFTVRSLHAGTYRLVVKDGERVYSTVTLADISVGPGETVPLGDVVLAKAPIVKKAASIRTSAAGGKKKATITIQVKASGVTPTGKVTVKLGSKTLKSASLRSGKAKITVTGQKKGKRVYTVVYGGDKRVLAKTVTTSKVKIK